MLSDEIKKVNLDPDILSKIKNTIINEERKNIRTREYSNQDMVKIIKKLIESSVA